jgi:hypothetical protein
MPFNGGCWAPYPAKLSTAVGPGYPLAGAFYYWPRETLRKNSTYREHAMTPKERRDMPWIIGGSPLLAAPLRRNHLSSLVVTERTAGAVSPSSCGSRTVGKHGGHRRKIADYRLSLRKMLRIASWVVVIE